MNTTGFPSPAQGYEEKPLDFNTLLIKNPAATFVMRFSGHIEQTSNITTGDLLIVDCSIKPARGMLAVVRIDGEFQCKQIESYTDETTKQHDIFEVFGIVRAVVRVL